MWKIVVGECKTGTRIIIRTTKIIKTVIMTVYVPMFKI